MDINNIDLEFLVVGKLQRINKNVVESTKQKYIFMKIYDGCQIKYKEIFTGYTTFDINNTIVNGYDIKYFGISYVYNIESISNYLPNNVKKISIVDLIWLINDINNPDIKKRIK